MPDAKSGLPRFASVAEAMRAVAAEPFRVSITYRADKVLVFSRFGTGEFSLREWKDAGGPMPSIGAKEQL